MPLYEYQCDACGNRFERIQKFSDPPIETCPNCSGSVRKLLSSPAIQFKGTGWYITDYAKKAPAGRDDGKAAAKPESGSGAESSPASSSGSSAAAGAGSGTTGGSSGSSGSSSGSSSES